MKVYFMNEEMEAKIYFKSQKRPISIVLETKEQKDELIKQMITCDIIKIGPLIFSRDNVLYLVFE